MLNECGEEKARGVLHPKCRGNRRNVNSFLFLVFFFLMVFKSTWNERVEARGQKQEPKMKGQSESLKVNSFPSLHFVSFLRFFFSLCFLSFLLLEKKKMPRESTWHGSAKAGAKSERAEWELESKLPPLCAYFFFSMVFFSLHFFFFAWEEENAKRKHLKWKCKSERAKVGVKNEKAE